MYKHHVRDKESLEKQVLEVTAEVAKSLAVLEQNMKKMTIEDQLNLEEPLLKFKAANEKLHEIIKNVLSHNKELQQTIQVQSAKIKKLEDGMTEHADEMKKMKAERAAKDKDFQDQLNEIRRKLSDPSESVETRMSTIVTTVMAAKRFMQPLAKHSTKASQ